MVYVFSSRFLVIITLKISSKESPPPQHSNKLSPSAAGAGCEMLTVHVRVSALMHSLTVTTGLAPSHISQTAPVTSQLLICHTKQHEFQILRLTPVLLCSFFIYHSYGVSWEPPWLGREGGAEGQEASQSGGELHVEHHHTEGEIFRACLTWFSVFPCLSSMYSVHSSVQFEMCDFSYVPLTHGLAVGIRGRGQSPQAIFLLEISISCWRCSGSMTALVRVGQ